MGRRKGAYKAEKQEEAALVLARTGSIAQTARMVGVSKATMKRWLKDPEFREQLERERQALLHLLRRALNGEARTALSAALSLLNRLLTAPNGQGDLIYESDKAKYQAAMLVARPYLVALARALLNLPPPHTGEDKEKEALREFLKQLEKEAGEENAKRG